jgi:hypothetical protein
MLANLCATFFYGTVWLVVIILVVILNKAHRVWLRSLTPEERKRFEDDVNSGAFGVADPGDIDPRNVRMPGLSGGGYPAGSFGDDVKAPGQGLKRTKKLSSLRSRCEQM